MKQHVAHVASEFAFVAFALALVSVVAAFPVELCCPRLGAGAFGRVTICGNSSAPPGLSRTCGTLARYTPRSHRSVADRASGSAAILGVHVLGWMQLLSVSPATPARVLSVWRC